MIVIIRIYDQQTWHCARATCTVLYCTNRLATWVSDGRVPAGNGRTRDSHTSPAARSYGWMVASWHQRERNEICAGVAALATGPHDCCAAEHRIRSWRWCWHCVDGLRAAGLGCSIATRTHHEADPSARHNETRVNQTVQVLRVSEQWIREAFLVCKSRGGRAWACNVDYWFENVATAMAGRCDLHNTAQSRPPEPMLPTICWSSIKD